MKKIIGIALLASLLSACSTSPTGRSQLMLISPKAAIVQSQKAYASTVTELSTNNKLITDKKWVKRISNITGRLVTQAVAMQPETKDWQWSVAIIDDPETLNAWCMAGGRMAIYRGIVEKLKLNDDEIAQIMGHEISHALANHTAERMSRAMAIQGGLAAAGAASENNKLVLTGAALAAKFALELPNSRTAETEADRIGIEIATRAGYKPSAAVSLWKKMQQASGGKAPPEFMSTHPSSANRATTLASLEKEMLNLNPKLKKGKVSKIAIITDAKQL